MLQAIYDRIESLIEAKHMTKKAFCEELHISTGNFEEWKRGNSVPSAKKLIEIAQYFNVSLDWLMTGKEKQRNGSIKEQRADYGIDLKGQLNCQWEQLSEQELAFIAEYVRFCQHRKQQGQTDS